MKNRICILFCEDPFDPKKVDGDYEQESVSAKQNGIEALLFNFDELVNGKLSIATKRITPSSQMRDVIYRGWMLTLKQYGDLYDDLLSKNFRMINTPEEYRNCHYLPDSLKYIEAKTPKTVYEKWKDSDSFDKLIQKTTVFGKVPVVIKDYVKSEKHDWETACFVKDVSDTQDLRQKVNRFLELRGEYLNEGIVIREFIDLNNLVIHSKSGMPLTEEYRLFFYNGKLLAVYDYWEEGEYNFMKPLTEEFEKIATSVESNFFSMDIARKIDGDFVIIELGDAQVSGLPDNADKNDFYKRLASASN